MSAARRSTSAIGLLAAAALLAGAAGGAPKSSRTTRAARADTVLVRLGNEVITPATVQKRVDDLPEQMRSQYTSPEGKQRLLERLVEERIWLQTAMKKGVADRPQVQRQLEAQHRDLLVRTYVNEVMAGNPAPSDSQALAYYNEHQSEYRTPATVTLSHIQTKTEADAKKVKLAARKEDWKKLVERFSTDTLTRANAGALGVVTREGMFGSLGPQPALAESAFAVGAGKIGGPFSTSRGWHVLKVDAVKDEALRPFDQVRATIVRQLTGQQQQEYYQARLAEARAALGVKVDSAAFKGYLSQKKSAREVFNEAQMAGPAQARMDAYRRLLADHPDSDVAPQAQFMLGFIHSEELKDYPTADKLFRELLVKYPKSELVPSAQWMIDHMRTESAPAFMNLEADSSEQTPQASKRPTGKP